MKDVDCRFANHLFRVWSSEEGGLLEGREVSGEVGGKPAGSGLMEAEEGKSRLHTGGAC